MELRRFGPIIRRAPPHRGRPAWAGLAILLAGGAASCVEAPPAGPTVTLLTPREQLIRLSMDLRGIHPTEADLAAIDAQPGLYDDFVERYLQDPRYLDRMAEVFDLAYHTRTRDLPYDTEGTTLEGVDEGVLARELGEEPLRLLRHILEEDLPYSEIVTSPVTFATPLTAAYWDMSYPEGASGWQPSSYQDGRPGAGVLTMSTFWARYPSMGGNANRHRANAISRIFLCDDFLARPIVVNRTAVDQLAEDPETAIRTNSACQSCHASLDPLASNMFGFFNDAEELEGARLYRPENEELWRAYSGKSPGYFGRPLASLPELGQALAADPRFGRCAVETVFEGLTQRTATDADWTELEGLSDAFLASGMDLKALSRAIVTSDLYRAARIEGDDALAARVSTVKTASPAQLEATIAALTGYTLRFGEAGSIGDNALGLAVLAGGVDGRTVLTPTYDPSVGLVFVQERLAQAAAWHVVRADLSPDREGDPLLLAYVTAEDTPQADPDAFDLQIRELYLRATGLPLPEDAPEIAELTGLWVDLHSMSASATDAWAGVVAAVLRDPRVLFY